MRNDSEAKKTNAMRILDKDGIAYEVITYPWDEEHIDAMHAAQSIGMEPEEVLKTIVLRNQDKEVFVFCLPAPYEISLKKARVVTGSKEIDLIKTEELRTLTGYIRGGCSPLGMIHTFPTFIEETVQMYDRICVSGGLRGIQLRLSPTGLAQACQGRFADIV